MADGIANGPDTVGQANASPRQRAARAPSLRTVVSLLAYRSRETVAVLRYALDMALSGKLTGMAIAFRVEGQDRFAVTGEFKRNRAEGLAAITRAQWKQNLAMDAEEAPMR
jgi:hypothetical protein